MRVRLALASPALFLLMLFFGCGGDTSGTLVPVGCDFYEDNPGDGLVTIRVRNETGLDVYLPTACDVAEFTVEKTSTPEPGVSYGTVGRSTCLQTCETLQNEEGYVCESSGCTPGSIRVPAGESVDLQWGGTGRREEEMPAGCWFSDNPEATCTHIVGASAGSYQVSLHGFTECADGCSCDAAGVCSGEAKGLEATVQSAAFDYPGAPPVVDVVFELCAFGCAGG